MQKRVTIITITVVSLLFVGVILGLFFMASSKGSKNLADISSKVDTAQTQIDTLKAAKDTNGFTATEVVKSFFEEVKSDDSSTAKLYLAPEVQTMDIKATLKLGSDLANITTGDNFEEANGDNMAVSMTFVLPTDETTVRTFDLSRYNDAWKITGVSAE